MTFFVIQIIELSVFVHVHKGRLRSIYDFRVGLYQYFLQSVGYNIEKVDCTSYVTMIGLANLLLRLSAVGTRI